MLRSIVIALCLFPALVFSAAAQITFSSVTHDFNNVPKGQSVVYGVTLTNDSSSAFAFDLTLSGSSEFTSVNNCGSSVPAGAKCQINFTFAPGTIGTVSADWSLAENGQTFVPSDGGTLTGTGLNFPGFTVTTSTHNFGTAKTLTKSAAYGVVLSNSLSNPITLTINTKPAHYKDFPIATNNCPATLEPYQTCNLSWQFYPQTAGILKARYTISGVDSSTGESVILSSSTAKSVAGVDMGGEGVTSTGVQLSTSGYNYGTQGVNTKSPTYGVMLTNATANTIDLTYTGSSAAFPSVANDCGASLAPYTYCNLQWAFEPTASGGQSAFYGIAATANGVGVPIKGVGGATVTGVSLVGTGIAGTLKLSKPANNFGPWVTGTTSPAFTTTLSNTTADTIDLAYSYTSGSDNADFPQTEDTCGSTLLSNSSCTLAWTFSPTAIGLLTTGYNINAKLPSTGSPISLTSGAVTVSGVSLSGFAQSTGGVSLDTASNNFGEQGVGGVSATYTTTLYNTSGATVTLTFAYSNANAAKNFTLITNNCGTSLVTNSDCTLTWEFAPIVAGNISVVYDITAKDNGVGVPITSGGATVSGVTLLGAGVE
jgi:hypothetical protein